LNLQAIAEILTSVRRWNPYPSYKDAGVEWLAKIPIDWQMLRFKQVARLMYGDSLPASGREDGDVPVYGSNGIVGYHSQANTLAPALVIGRKGSYGKVNYTERICYAIDTTYYIDRRTSEVDLRWLYYTMLVLALDAYSEDSAIPGLSRDYVYSRSLPVPKIEFQRTIVGFLDQETAKIDALVAKKERLIALLQEKRAALITHAVTKGLDPNPAMKDSGIEWLGEIPAHWEVKRLKWLTETMVAGPFGSSLTKDLYTRDGYRVYGQEQVIPGDFSIGDYYISQELYRLMTRYAVRPGDVLISCVGTFGKIAVVPEGIEAGIINPRLIKAIPKKSIISPIYLGILLKSRVAFDQMEQVSRGGTMGVINIGLLSETLLPVPDLPEQLQIADYIRNETAKIDALIAKVREGIEKLTEYRTALISAAVTGKIDVREENHLN
jgi:type I restriction enzyme S subunit